MGYEMTARGWYVEQPGQWCVTDYCAQRTEECGKRRTGSGECGMNKRQEGPTTEDEVWHLDKKKNRVARFIKLSWRSNYSDSLLVGRAWNATLLPDVINLAEIPDRRSRGDAVAAVLVAPRCQLKRRWSLGPPTLSSSWSSLFRTVYVRQIDR